MKNSCGIVTLIAKSKGIQRLSSTRLFCRSRNGKSCWRETYGIVTRLERQTACWGL